MKIKRFRVRLIGHIVGVSIYAQSFEIRDNEFVEFNNGMAFVAVFDVSSVESVLDGPTADNILWLNPTHVMQNL